MIRIHLAKLLEQKDMSQRKLHKLTGIRHGTINAYYHEFAKRINLDDLDILCKTLNCRLDELIEYIPDKNKNSGV